MMVIQRKVSFDTNEELGDKIDKLGVMIGKLASGTKQTIQTTNPSE